MLDIISVFFNLLRYVLWPSMWSILENLPYLLEKSVYSSIFGWDVYSSIFGWNVFYVCIQWSEFFMYVFNDLNTYNDQIIEYIHKKHSFSYWLSVWISVLWCRWGTRVLCFYLVTISFFPNTVSIHFVCLDAPILGAYIFIIVISSG